MPVTIITVILVLIILVVIHELGHFTAAKLLGIKVEEFGFGLPPRAWGKKIGETLYSLNWLPVGGFVRLYGEDAEHPEHVKKERSRAFFAKKPWERTIVLTAGVVMNFILGWIIFSYLATIGLPYPKDHVLITGIAEGSPAETSGLLTEDEVISISTNDREALAVANTQELVTTIGNNLDEEIHITVLRDESLVTIPIVPRSEHPEGQGALGIEITDLEVVTAGSFPESISLGFSYSIYVIRQTLDAIGDSLQKLFAGNTAEIQVGGFVLVGQVVGTARQAGFENLLYVIGMLSLNLALINILPFPALDGGRLAFVFYEGLTGKKPNARWEMYLHQFGMVFLLLLMLLITFNDILRLGRG